MRAYIFTVGESDIILLDACLVIPINASKYSFNNSLGIFLKVAFSFSSITGETPTLTVLFLSSEAVISAPYRLPGCSCLKGSSIADIDQKIIFDIFIDRGITNIVRQ